MVIYQSNQVKLMFTVSDTIVSNTNNFLSYRIVYCKTIKKSNHYHYHQNLLNKD